MSRSHTLAGGASAAKVAGVLALVAGLAACGGAEETGKAATAPPAAPAAAEAKAPEGPLPTLLVVQAQFDDKMKPQPAKLVLMRTDGKQWFREEISDPDSNVFHKAIAWRDGILTIGAERAPKPATLKHWKRQPDGTWAATTIWSRAWEGASFNRFRDLEIGDVDGDGQEELVLATHDRGVVAVGHEQPDGTWRFDEMDEKADTFVHEIEIGDVDGDGKLEFYATPSDRNKASGESQPGSVVRYDWRDGTFVRTTVVDFTESHAKEILVTDIDGDGTDELYVVREAHTVHEDGETKRLDPVRIVRYAPTAEGWQGTVVATLDDDQTRFLVPGDLDGDGKRELLAAAKESGLWRLVPKDDGTFEAIRIDADSGGFEHASHVADLDGDGQVEIYVAADTQKQFRRYVHNAATRKFDRTVMGPIGPKDFSHITWNIQNGTF